MSLKLRDDGDVRKQQQRVPEVSTDLGRAGPKETIILKEKDKHGGPGWI